MNGDKVRKNDCPNKFLFRFVVFLGILNNGKRRSHSLVAASGNYDDGQLAAAHARIAPGCGSRHCTNFNIVAVCFQQNPADVCTVIVRKAGGGNCGIILNLSADGVADVREINRIGKINDFGNRHCIFFSNECIFGFFKSNALGRINNFAVFFNQHDVCVIINNSNANAVAARKNRKIYVENKIIVGRTNDDVMQLEKIQYALFAVFVNIGNYFENF